MKRPVTQASSRQAGIALIEVLVAVVILAIGLLGVAAMQSVSSQMTNGAEQRTQAVLLTTDMMERIRANRPNRLDYNGVDVDSAVDNCNIGFAPAPGASVSANDINEWTNLVVCLLPEGEAQVQVNAADREVIITVDWARQDPDGQPVTLRTMI